MQSNVLESPFFCHICGAPPTWRGLLAATTLKYLDAEEGNFDHRDYRYPNFIPSMRDLGYDARLLRPKDIRWLDGARLVTNKMVDTLYDKERVVPPWVTPVALYVDLDSGAFNYPHFYPDACNVLQCNIDGYLVHDTCFKLLGRVDQHLQATCSPEDLDLERLWSWLERGLEDRNNDLVDWGFGEAFHGLPKCWKGKRFDDDDRAWIPLKGSMWTVMNPKGPFKCQPLLDRASAFASTQSGYSFTFSVKPTQASSSAQVQSGHNVSSNVLSLLPRELQLSILELLPSSSVLNLFLASPDFRRHAEHLPPSFWKSRLFFDVPWCADIILSQLQTAQSNRSEKGTVRFDKLLRFLKEFYASPGQEPDGENLEFKGLRNRRRIWMLCERIVREMEVQRGNGNDCGSSNEGGVALEHSESEAEE